MRKKKEKKTYNAMHVCCYYHQYQFPIDHCHSKYKQEELKFFMPIYVIILVSSELSKYQVHKFHKFTDSKTKRMFLGYKCYIKRSKCSCNLRRSKM